jgi:hypothetical protein
LLSRLGIKATVRTDLKETGGLLTPEEMKGVVADVAKLANNGDLVGARALLKSTKWAKLGMSGVQIQARFNWAELEPDFPRNVDTGKHDVPWHSTGLESENTAVTRTKVRTKLSCSKCIH